VNSGYSIVTKYQASRKNKSLSVAPSPFNSIKLELAVVFILGGLLLAVLDSITQDLFLQISILFGAGLTGMVWIIWRTYGLLKHYSKVSSSEHQSADADL
jgi:hypothetical protein